MRSPDEIKNNPAVQIIAQNDEFLSAFVTLRKSGRPRNYTMLVGFDEQGLEHASIACLDSSHIPVWYELCELKDIVWEPEEECYQIFPKRSQYVSIMNNCMHIWRHK